MKLSVPFLGRAKPFVAVVRLSGAIASGPRGRLSDEALAPLLERAFTRGKPAAVALLLNSPGGSPVQSSLIAARIRRLAIENNVPVHAFVEDVAASGGYWLATAADKIWLDPGSLVGSIGVISAGFGFQDLIERHGIERRIHTAGASKSWLDPFRPERPEDVARLQGLMGQMHQVFVQQVLTRRPQLTGKDNFTGDIWLGQQAVDLGLADGIGHLEPVMKSLYGEKLWFRPYQARRGLLARFGGGVAAGAAEGALHSVEERAAFARFGL